LTLNISETVRHTDIVSLKYYYGLIHDLRNSVTSNDVEWRWVT